MSKTHFGNTVDKAINLDLEDLGKLYKESTSPGSQVPRSFYPEALPSEPQSLLHPAGTRRRRRNGEGTPGS